MLSLAGLAEQLALRAGAVARVHGVRILLMVRPCCRLEKCAQAGSRCQGPDVVRKSGSHPWKSTAASLAPGGLQRPLKPRHMAICVVKRGLERRSNRASCVRRRLACKNTTNPYQDRNKEVYKPQRDQYRNFIPKSTSRLDGLSTLETLIGAEELTASLSHFNRPSKGPPVFFIRVPFLRSFRLLKKNQRSASG